MAKMTEAQAQEIQRSFERTAQAVKDEIAKAQAAEDAAKAQAAADAAAQEQALQAGIAQMTQMMSMVEATYLIAAADGDLSEAERAKITQGIRRISDGQASDEQIKTMLEMAGDKMKAEGLQARSASIASVIQDPELRRATFQVAAATAWLDKGIGVKQGLALQAVSKAMGIEMNEMHKLLGAAHGS
jgi:hypothetical protein